MAHPSYLQDFDDAALNEKSLAALHQLESDFALDGTALDGIVKQFMWEFNEGLNRNASTPEEADTFLPMIPTFIHAVPDGTEKGNFLALDLGGTNLRVCSVSLDGKKNFTIKQQKYKVSEALKTGEATVLFDYIAQSVEHFIANHLFHLKLNETDTKLHLGFTFSFPVKQTALDRGTLINWTKGFEAKNAKGKDVMLLLQDALDKREVPVQCSALVNDTVGTMLSRAYHAGDAKLGAIFGTGTNAAYLEKTSKIKTLDIEGQNPAENMIVNTEWGAFDNERKVLKITPYDNKLDRESINPRKQAFEKMISGMYLGEIFRNILLAFIDSNLLYQGRGSSILNTHYGVDTAVMSELESAPSSAPADVPDRLAKLSVNGHSSSEEISRLRSIIAAQVGIPEKFISDADCLLTRRISEIVGTRACRLSGAAIAAVVKQTGNDKADSPDFAVGVDGSLVEFYPLFDQRVRAALREILGKTGEEKVKIGLAKDGSGVGAALSALSAKKQQESSISRVTQP